MRTTSQNTSPQKPPNAPNQLDKLDQHQPAASPAPMPPRPLAAQAADFTAEGAPPPGMVATSEPVGSHAQGKAHPQDAVALLMADHVAVCLLFADYAPTRTTADKKALVAKLCTALSVHVQIEEELFYPAIEAALTDPQLVPEARLEHTGVKNLIAQLEGVEPNGVMYDAKVKVLGDYVKHHVKEEQTQMFPQARASSIDLVELGQRMTARQNELIAQRAR